MYLAALFYAILMLFVLVLGIAGLVAIVLVLWAALYMLNAWLQKGVQDYRRSQNS